YPRDRRNTIIPLHFGHFLRPFPAEPTMVGQGRPSTGRMRFALRVGLLVGILFRLSAAAPLALAAQSLLIEPMHLRVGWGGGAERQWHGSISIDNGTLA